MVWVCTNCRRYREDATNNSPLPTTHSCGTIQKDCTTCGGDGWVSGYGPCDHGYNTAHSFCEHECVGLHD